MGYRSIDNLYKNQMIMLFKECYAMEKIHGTSAHVSFKRERQIVFGRNIEGCAINQMTEEEFQAKFPDKIDITFFSGGASHEQFVSLFDKKSLEDKFRALGFSELTVYGEAYGGKMQGMSKTYGPTLRFAAFEVKSANGWMNVPNAEKFALELGFEFVPYNKIPTTEEAINFERDRDSAIAVINGMGFGHIREGVVLRPLYEFVNQGENGGPVRAKHKRDEFKETKTSREKIDLDPNYIKVLEDAQAIADEWVTDMRLRHVLDSLISAYKQKRLLVRCLNPDDSVPEGIYMPNLGDIIPAMFSDVEREAAGEIVIGKETRSAISKKTVQLFKAYEMEKNKI